MGSLTSRPKVPTTTQPQVIYVPTPQPVYTSSSSTAASTTAATSTDTAAGTTTDTTQTAEEQQSEARTQNLLTRDRSLYGTVTTSFRGLLGLASGKNGQSKTLLGE